MKGNSRFEATRSRIIYGLSIKPLDFASAGSYIRDAQALLEDLKYNQKNDAKTLEHLNTFFDNVWKEGSRDVEGWELSIESMITRINKLKC